MLMLKVGAERKLEIDFFYIKNNTETKTCIVFLTGGTKETLFSPEVLFIGTLYMYYTMRGAWFDTELQRKTGY